MKHNEVKTYRQIIGYLDKVYTHIILNIGVDIHRGCLNRRCDSGLADGEDNSVSLTEGYYDAGQLY
jgi:hypothetical protein